MRVGRYSSDPSVVEGGRKQYSLDQGVIGATWKSVEGSQNIQDIPYFGKTEVPEWKAYLDKRGIGGLSMPELRRMRMRSRSYCTFIIHEPESFINCGVIVFESETPFRFTFKKLEKLLSTDFGNIVKYMVLRRR